MSLSTPCVALIAHAVRYIAAHAADIRPGLVATATRPGCPIYRQLLAAVDAAALVGDVEATKAACKTWWRYVLAQQEAPAADPAPPLPPPKRRRFTAA